MPGFDPQLPAPLSTGHTGAFPSGLGSPGLTWPRCVLMSAGCQTPVGFKAFLYHLGHEAVTMVVRHIWGLDPRVLGPFPGLSLHWPCPQQEQLPAPPWSQSPRSSVPATHPASWPRRGQTRGRGRAVPQAHPVSHHFLARALAGNPMPEASRQDPSRRYYYCPGAVFVYTQPLAL